MKLLKLLFDLLAPLLGKIFGNPAVRGTLKTLPVGNFLYELSEFVRLKRQGADPVHSPLSLLMQGVWLVLILYWIYGLFTGSVTLDQVIKFISSEGSNVSPAASIDVNDTLR